MDQLEEKLKQLAVYSPEKYKEADITQIITELGLNVEKKYMGQLSRVYRVHDTPWMIKEARWDLSVELFAGTQLPFPVMMTSRIMKMFSFTFLPDKKEILNQYGMYLEFVQYFGYFKDEKAYYHPNRELIFNSQRNIRETLLFFKPQLERMYKVKFNPKLDKILSSNVKYLNFLPKEYLIIGKSISPENKGKVTSLIFQEFIKGNVLRDFPQDKLSRKHKEQLILMIYLLLLMHMQVNLIPDTRPRYHVFEAYDWLTRTDNIMVSKERLVFIDTRWFWDTEANIIKKGIIIPSLVLNKAKMTINMLLEQV